MDMATDMATDIRKTLKSSFIQLNNLCFNAKLVCYICECEA